MVGWYLNLSTSSPIPVVLNAQQLCEKVANKRRMAEVQPFRLRKVQWNIGIQRENSDPIFSQLQSVRKLKRPSMWSRDSSFWRSFCLLKKNILAFNTRSFQCCKSRIPLHYFFSAHNLSSVCSKLTCWNWNRFHSSVEGFWSHGWCYTNVSFRILSQTFRIKTALLTTSL